MFAKTIDGKKYRMLEVCHSKSSAKQVASRARGKYKSARTEYAGKGIWYVWVR